MPDEVPVYRPASARVPDQNDVPGLGGGGEWVLRLATADAEPPESGEYRVGGAHCPALSLHAEGKRCGRKRVARLMRARGLSATLPRHRTRTTDSRHEHPVAPNLLERDFTADAPNTKWVADITAIWTMEGWLYLAVVLDIFSRMVVGWAMDAHREAVLVESALQMALARRHPEPGLLHHSDRGSQYTCQDYQALLARCGIVVSMSRKGDCYDNALMESFNGTLKTECVERESYQTRSQARRSIFEYLEAFYNRQRLHSSLGYVSPVVYEQQVR
jgi:putative transposase